MGNDSKIIISVKGGQKPISFFVRKAYDLSMEYDVPITVKLQKGSWEAIVFQTAVDAAKTIAPFISIGTFAWVLVKWVRRRKDLKLTGIGQNAARDKSITLLKKKYRINAELVEERSEETRFRFIFKYDNSQKTVLIDKTTGGINVYEIDELHTQKPIKRPRIHIRKPSKDDISTNDEAGSKSPK